MRSGASWKAMLTAAVLLVPATAALAQDAEDDPGRGVARISVINGDVSVRLGDSGDWVAAAVNAPLVVGDGIATGPGSRAEVQFDYANMIRLGSDTEVRITELESRRYQLQVVRGMVEYRVLRDSNADVDLSTPAVSVRPSKRGAYRVAVRDDGEVEVTSRAGDVELYTPRGVEYVHPGHTVLVRNGPSGPELEEVATTPKDDFDRWSEQRDKTLERSNAYRYVNPSIYGADDLDPYGRWIFDPAYGWVWAPSVQPGWAPYRYGRWVWEDWYGWTWVSSDPWGWAPYHYGRWYRARWGWSWYPGAFVGVHVWRPGLVAFFGFGAGGLGGGFGYGNVGWVPLGPREPYYPWYGRGYYGGYGRFNVTNVNVINIYRNARVPNGISGMEVGGFGRGNGRIGQFSAHQIREAGLVRGQLPLAPSHESLRFANRDPRGVPRHEVRNTQFFTRLQPTRVERVPFAQQQRAFQGAAVAPQGGNRMNAPVRNSGSPAAAPGGWRRAAEPANNRNQAPAVQNSGWRRFGEAQQRGMANTGSRGAGARVPEAGQPASSVRNVSPGNNGNWRRFGAGGGSTPGRAVEPTPARRGPGADPAPARGSQPRSWQRFGEPGNGASAFGPSERPSGSFRTEPRSLQISPPVVRERSTPRMQGSPRMQGGSSSGAVRGGGGGGHVSRGPGSGGRGGRSR